MTGAVVLLVAAGGTISSRSTPEGVRGALDGAGVLARAGVDPERVDVVDANHGPSWAYTAESALDIATRAVDGARSERYAGVVVTHGTDTMEESAFLSWLAGGAAPIVFTGAMRHDDHPEADGPANLRSAVELAAVGRVDGPVVHLAGEQHHARWVTKTDTSSPTTFREVGGAGTPPPPPPFAGAVEPRVAQIPAHNGVDGELVGWHLDRGARGLVVEGTGAGNVNGALVPGIERAIAAGVPVVVTSRCWTGPVAPIYGPVGGGRHLADLGVIGGGDLPTHKARVALSVALRAADGIDGVRGWFAKLFA